MGILNQASLLVREKAISSDIIARCAPATAWIGACRTNRNPIGRKEKNERREKKESKDAYVTCMHAVRLHQLHNVIFTVCSPDECNRSRQNGCSR